jgi:hypothetical protein
MSRLVKEDANWLHLVDYLHSNKESYSDWELDENGKERYKELVHMADTYACYEVKVSYRINKNTGEVVHDSFSTT